ncbi:microtubule-associated serine/threonine-protein kinase 3 isoform X22 [Hydra vulgaris]|uniref:non-specific serine/threonine protein kinase n=2 Tax=Hydra vulgaris TaxID=6087 RepID=A0ABM4C777_HYDVU
MSLPRQWVYKEIINIVWMICQSLINSNEEKPELSKNRPNTLNLSLINYKQKVLYRALSNDQLRKYDKNAVKREGTEDMYDTDESCCFWKKKDFLLRYDSQNSLPANSSEHPNLYTLEPEEIKPSFGRSTSSDVFQPIQNDEPISNLLRMRNNSSLGNSDPSLSLSAGEQLLSRRFSICNISPRRPRTLLPHSPSPPRALSPVGNDYSKNLSSSTLHAPIPILHANNRSFQSGRRWSVASSGYSTNTQCSSEFSSQTSSQEKLNLLMFDDNAYARQQSHDSTFSDVDDEISSARSPKPFRGRSRSLSPTRNENELFILNKLYIERFPKAKQQMEENLRQFIAMNSNDTVESNFSDAAISFVSHQIVEIAKTVLNISEDPEKNITSGFFYGISESLDKLLQEVKYKTNSADIEHINKMVPSLLMIFSRPARLLECLEFDPSSFYTQLELEQVAISEQHVDIDMTQYIRNKLGIVEVKPEETEKTTVRKHSIIAEPKEEDFTLIKVISNGAYGSVHLVRHKATKQRFAMKKMSKHHLMHKNQVQQIFNERDIMTFAQNPFVVTLVCTFETKKSLCMVMEYVEGGDCASLLKNIGVMTIDLARQYFAETVLAVEYIHEYGIIHRDLKPDNLLITALGHIKLTDFGLSKIGLMNVTTNICEQTTNQFNDFTVFGTPDYIAPEVILRKGYGKPVDYWSLGVILYEFLVGITPFYGETVEDVFDSVLVGEIEWPEGEEALPIEAVELIKALLVNNPMDRLGTGGAFEVKEHKFFINMNWNHLLRVKAEFVPVLGDEEDTSYFDTREDRYNHFISDEEENDEGDIELGNFSSCSPRFSRILSSVDNELSREVRDLQQSTKEVNSIKEHFDEISEETDKIAHQSSINISEKTCLITDEEDGNDHNMKLLQFQRNVSSPYKDKSETDSGAMTDNGAMTSSSLDSTSSGNFMRQISLDTKKRLDDSDRETDGSNSSCDLSPRRFLSTATFTMQRVPSPKQPSPLVIDTSREDDLTLQGTSSVLSEPNTPLGKSSKLVCHNKLHRTKSTPPMLDFSRAVPELDLAERELIKKRTRRRNARGSFQKLRSEACSPPPENPTESLNIVSPTSIRPSIVIERGNLALGFSLKAIRVYIGNTSNYTMHHLVESVEEGSPAYEAGLRVNDLVTHINNESIQGLQHVEVVRLILQGGETISLSVTELDKTSIRTGRKRKSIGNRVITRPRSQSRSRINLTDETNRLTSKRSPLFRRIRRNPVRKTSSIKRVNKKGSFRVNAQTSENDSASSSTPSSISPNSMTSRPAFLHCVFPKLARSVMHSPRRRSVSGIPVSPLARAPQSSGRSPSPLTTMSSHTLISPTNSFSGHNKITLRLSSPVLRRARSPDSLAPTKLEDALNQAYLNVDNDDRRVTRTQSMKESKVRKGYLLKD